MVQIMMIDDSTVVLYVRWLVVSWAFRNAESNVVTKRRLTPVHKNLAHVLYPYACYFPPKGRNFGDRDKKCVIVFWFMFQNLAILSITSSCLFSPRPKVVCESAGVIFIIIMIVVQILFYLYCNIMYSFCKFAK